MEIRKATEKDIPQIIKLLYQVQKVHSDKRPDLFKAGGKKYSEEQLLEILGDTKKPIFVAVEEGIVLGYSFCMLLSQDSSNLTNIKTLYIDDLCVNEEARGKNIGSKLYQYVLEFAKSEGCYNVTLNVWTCNEAAMKFYEKCGMQVQKMGMETIL
ncbi:GNAT family N-acetyltransferase [Konateibacter massiliensis]|uniref:GNAT family N-acetyltransferase n=1 Tax=Konateibacter massiliensis TaxID=2002841 RepID=UPI000C159127|nr:GNAT family N-acetyltransferase [Konateibacter massiliensis]